MTATLATALALLAAAAASDTGTSVAPPAGTPPGRASPAGTAPAGRSSPAKAPAGTPDPGEPGATTGAPGPGSGPDDAFPRLYAVTRGFRAGRPAAVKVIPGGREVLFLHGTADDDVHLLHAIRLADAPFRAGVPATFVPLAGTTHLPADPATRETLVRSEMAFLRRALGRPAADGTQGTRP
jgi:hypothetical protein